MSRGHSFTLYAFSHGMTRKGERWADTGIRETFYGSAEAARQAAFEFCKELGVEDDTPWPRTLIEKIETPPISKDNLLVLLNDGVAAFIQKYEIIETID